MSVDYRQAVSGVMAAVSSCVGAGKVADYIPELATVDPRQFGFAVATTDGQVYCAGDADTSFSMQSISKVFTLALVLYGDGETIWRRVGREPSGSPFNSLIQLELERGIPRNPYINPGAIVVTDQLLADGGDGFATLHHLLRTETGNPDLAVDDVVAASEAGAGHRNRALAHLMADFGNMVNPVDDALEHYFRQCSVAITCRELARAGLLLARHGIRADGTRLLARSDVRHLIALMMTCGTYDAAGEFAYRVGLPCKSGVGGGILAIVPDHCAVAAWGPGLDDHGNSVSATAALAAFADLTGHSVF
ncbi:glutaminase [Amycolatopsis sp. NPDC051903]|uniref:glutaminase n=1 Tax=Amycolatopsis sp. NPDC051903 TaxID=3363936 RepID=UPI0037AB9B2D